jgi:membrane fusion protein (multidrug efflux system)
MSDASVSSPTAFSFVREEKKTETLSPQARRKLQRKRLFIGLGGLLALAALGVGGWWYWVGQRYISTDDAYVGADTAQITPQLGGTVRQVLVSDTAHVKRGQVLVQLDPADARLELAQAQAAYGQAVRHVQQYVANADGADATVAARASDYQRASENYQRRVVLARDGVIAQEQLTNARNDFESSRANLAAAQQSLASQQALIRGTDTNHNPEVLAAKAALDKAQLDVDRTVIRAPFDGVVAQKSAQIGQRVQVGQVLMSVVPVNRVYVDANFKEGQLAEMHPGQAVTLTSDVYGSDVVFHGRVQGLSGGTGSAFAVIPAQNATGNWIKVVQRLPVRVALNPSELVEHPLQVGLSMAATIDVTK